METKRKCQGFPKDRWSAQCHRDAVEEVDGRWYCKPHASGKRRSKATKEQNDAKYAAKKVHDATLRAQASRLSDALGTVVELDYIWTAGGRYSDITMVVPIEWLERLAAKVPA